MLESFQILFPFLPQPQLIHPYKLHTIHPKIGPIIYNSIIHAQEWGNMSYPRKS